VARMQEIENTVGEGDAALLSGLPPRGFRPGRNLCRRLAWRQSLLAATGWKCSTRSFLSGSLITSS
jgi:hypothetical protein